MRRQRPQPPAPTSGNASRTCRPHGRMAPRQPPHARRAQGIRQRPRCRGRHGARPPRRQPSGSAPAPSTSASPNENLLTFIDLADRLARLSEAFMRPPSRPHRVADRMVFPHRSRRHSPRPCRRHARPQRPVTPRGRRHELRSHRHDRRGNCHPPASSALPWSESSATTPTPPSPSSRNTSTPPTKTWRHLLPFGLNKLSYSQARCRRVRDEAQQPQSVEVNEWRPEGWSSGSHAFLHQRMPMMHFSQVCRRTIAAAHPNSILTCPNSQTASPAMFPARGTMTLPA